MGHAGQKLNAVTTAEDGEALEQQRHEWLRRLEAPRGRAVGGLPCAVWEPSRSLAQVTRDKGRDLNVLGHHAEGSQWLRPEEALCLFEDSLIALEVLIQEGTATAPLTVQEAYQLFLGGPAPLVDGSAYRVFAHLFRSNFVARHRSLEALSADVPQASLPIAVFEVYHRRKFSRRAAADGTLPPLYAVAVFCVPARMPPIADLARLRDACAPARICLACTWQSDVLFFRPEWPSSTAVHGPADVDTRVACDTSEIGDSGPFPSLPPSPPSSPPLVSSDPQQISEPHLPSHHGVSGFIISGEDLEEDPEEDLEEDLEVGAVADGVAASSRHRIAPAAKQDTGVEEMEPQLLKAPSANTERLPVKVNALPSSAPPESILHQRLRRFAVQATDALRTSFATGINSSRTGLDATASSAARCAAQVEASARESSQAVVRLRELAQAMRDLHDDDEINSRLWPSNGSS